MSRMRVAAGLVLALAGGWSAGSAADLLQRARTGMDSLVLAAAVIAVLVATGEPRRLVPSLTVSGAALIAVHGPPAHLADRWQVPAVVGGVTLALSATGPGRPGRAVVFLWTRRTVLRDALPGRVSGIAVLGTIDLDLRDTTAPDGLVLTATAVVGHIRLLVPAQWPVELDDLPPASIHLDERGRRDMIDRALPVIRLRLNGLLSSVLVDRW